MMNPPHLPHQIHTFPHLHHTRKTTAQPHHHTPPYRGVGVWCGRVEAWRQDLHAATPHHTLNGGRPHV